MGSTTVSTFDGSKYGTSYSFTAPSGGSVITSASFSILAAQFATESLRRGQGNKITQNPGSYSTQAGTIGGGGNPSPNPFAVWVSDLSNYSGSGNITNTQGNAGYNQNGSTVISIDNTTVFGGYATSLPSGMSYGSIIYASHLSSLATSLNTAAAACLCNCNYCTCNCNYCTCNCNYWCTCNCNYSDSRLKENIELINSEGELNVYSYTYLWDKTKTYIGVMAQELVGTKYESALGKDTNGYYFVDYSQLPVTFKEA
jgi:hypothetical protein